MRVAMHGKNTSKQAIAAAVLIPSHLPPPPPPRPPAPRPTSDVTDPKSRSPKLKKLPAGRKPAARPEKSYLILPILPLPGTGPVALNVPNHAGDAGALKVPLNVPGPSTTSV
jgi:hypothetical protein